MNNHEIKTRTESDSMGPMQVPADAYYGASTQRAVLNFPISTARYPRSFIYALALIKQSAAKVNMDLGLLDKKICDAVVKAAQEVMDGKFDSHFVVDIYQTGSGTSTNMNANEIIANRATEILGGKLGQKLVHPNDHVNMGQSSNDVIPTASHLAAVTAIKKELLPALDGLHASLKMKAKEFWPIVKTGRTHLQDATPIRLGQEFEGFASQVELSISRSKEAIAQLSDVALGGTAVGTGINTHAEFSSRVCKVMSQVLGADIKETKHHFQAQATMDAMVDASGRLRTVSVSLMKVANDIRWMGSGPRAGIGELNLPEVQPGSSIMPGKVNPVIAEALIQACAQVIGNDVTVGVAGQGSYFELNMMWPVGTYNLLQSVSLLGAASANFSEQCVKGITATTKGPDMVERGLMMATALAPVVGYDIAADIAKTASKNGKTIKEVAKEKTKLTDQELVEILNPAKMTEPGAKGAGGGG
ncbi:MAG: class II fumarate hydratase [Dehalococcoidia bacterium]|nr:class II fumarate hydratase [Dehalococcoidia bacterium]